MHGGHAEHIIEGLEELMFNRIDKVVGGEDVEFENVEYYTTSNWHRVKFDIVSGGKRLTVRAWLHGVKRAYDSAYTHIGAWHLGTGYTMHGIREYFAK